MIGFLRGRVLEKQPNRIIVDVQGVGYEVLVPLSTYYDVGDEGTEVALRVHTHVREDALQLFGFRTVLEQQLFERLIGISGIGPKLAIVALICFFPITVNLLDGLRSAPPEPKMWLSWLHLGQM